jgi:hypothetical protein
MPQGAILLSMKNHKLEAVFDSDLESILKDLGMLDKLNNGSLRCYYCKEVISLSNLQYIFPKKGQIVVSCNKPDCVLRLEGEF